MLKPTKQLRNISYKNHHKVSGIYLIKWDEYFYYGQSVDMYARKRQHMTCLNRGIHSNPILQNVFNKHGMPLFLEVELCEKKDLNKNEQVYLDKYKGDKFCCNICFTATGFDMSDEFKQYLSELKTGTKLDKEHKEKISKGLKEAYKENKRVSHFKGLHGEKNYFFGKNHTDEAKAKMTGKRESLSGGNNPRARKVICTKTNTIYSCVRDAAIMNGYNFSTLYGKLSGGKKNNTTLLFYNGS